MPTTWSSSAEPATHPRASEHNLHGHINSPDQQQAGLSLALALAIGLLFGLAALATLDDPATAASAAVVATLLLGTKPQLHSWIAKLDETEMRATLQLMLISVVMLPIIPNKGFGPADALNSYELWWMVVLISNWPARHQRRNSHSIPRSVNAAPDPGSLIGGLVPEAGQTHRPGC